MPSTGYMIRHLPVIAFSKSSFHKPTDPVNFFSVFQFSFCVCVCVCVWGGGCLQTSHVCACIKIARTTILCRNFAARHFADQSVGSFQRMFWRQNSSSMHARASKCQRPGSGKMEKQTWFSCKGTGIRIHNRHFLFSCIWKVSMPSILSLNLVFPL